MLCGLLGVNMSGSHASGIPKGIVPWRRKQICGDPGSKSRRGVMEWKGPREWAIERDSVKNKKSMLRSGDMTLRSLT
jgi:hypothetical protein